MKRMFILIVALCAITNITAQNKIDKTVLTKFKNSPDNSTGIVLIYDVVEFTAPKQILTKTCSLNKGTGYQLNFVFGNQGKQTPKIEVLTTSTKSVCASNFIPEKNTYMSSVRLVAKKTDIYEINLSNEQLQNYKGQVLIILSMNLRNGAANNTLSDKEIEEISTFLSKKSTNIKKFNHNFGSFTDSRDKNSYKTIQIGTQTWMAENLRFVPAFGSACYNNIADSCLKNGRLYDWKTAQTVCPPGWRIPTYDDWQNLVKTIGGVEISGKPLIETTYSNGNKLVTSGFSGIDTKRLGYIPLEYNETGFSAKSTGEGDENAGVFRDNNAAEYWSTDTFEMTLGTDKYEENELNVGEKLKLEGAYSWQISTSITRKLTHNKLKLAVRCVK